MNIESIFCLRVNHLVSIIEPANPSAAYPAVIVLELSVSASGRVITSIPINLIIAAIALGRVNISPRKNGERTKIQIRNVNLRANTCKSETALMA